MDETTRMRVHDLAAIRRCGDDALLYVDRLLAATPPLPRRDLAALREHRRQLGQIVGSVDAMQRRLRDTVSTT